MARWLPDNKENVLPAYATHASCVASIVINDQNKILTVKEKYHDIGYKLPTGVAKIREDFINAAIRETKEETGIDTEFVSVIAFWESHKAGKFGTSELLFVCALHP